MNCRVNAGLQSAICVGVSEGSLTKYLGDVTCGFKLPRPDELRRLVLPRCFPVPCSTSGEAVLDAISV